MDNKLYLKVEQALNSCGYGKLDEPTEQLLIEFIQSAETVCTKPLRFVKPLTKAMELLFEKHPDLEDKYLQNYIDFLCEGLSNHYTGDYNKDSVSQIVVFGHLYSHLGSAYFKLGKKTDDPAVIKHAYAMCTQGISAMAKISEINPSSNEKSLSFLAGAHSRAGNIAESLDKLFPQEDYLNKWRFHKQSAAECSLRAFVLSETLENSQFCKFNYSVAARISKDLLDNKNFQITDDSAANAYNLNIMAAILSEDSFSAARFFYDASKIANFFPDQIWKSRAISCLELAAQRLDAFETRCVEQFKIDSDHNWTYQNQQARLFYGKVDSALRTLKSD